MTQVLPLELALNQSIENVLMQYFITQNYTNICKSDKLRDVLRVVIEIWQCYPNYPKFTPLYLQGVTPPLPKDKIRLVSSQSEMKNLNKGVILLDTLSYFRIFYFWDVHDTHREIAIWITYSVTMTINATNAILNLLICMHLMHICS